jgi:hypothetical protein
MLEHNQSLGWARLVLCRVRHTRESKFTCQGRRFLGQVRVCGFGFGSIKVRRHLFAGLSKVKAG